MKLSVLDYGLLDYGKTPREALQETVCLAKEAEKLGFLRFWVAEHHNVSAFCASSPEMLMMHIADQTKTIRVGSGGITALHYSPYKIAELISTLEVLHPNRIDLGLSGTLGTTVVHRAMKSPHQKADYGEVLQQVKHYLSPHFAEQCRLKVQPQAAIKTQFFALSNSVTTAQKAGELGLGYVFGIFPYMQKNLLQEAQNVPKVYRESFQSTAYKPKPYVIFACFIIIADTDEEAESLAKCLDIWMLGKYEFNEFSHYPSEAEAKKYLLTPQEQVTITANRQRMIIGSPTRVKQELDTLTTMSEAQEVLAIPLVPEVQNRRKSLQLLAELYL